jgi:hypothetical protein
MMVRTEKKVSLNLWVDRDLIRKIISVGKEFDVDNRGLYDARGGCVNFWCSPQDKPACWGEPTQGSFPEPRDYVGGLYWEWDDTVQRFSLYVDVTPYALAEKGHSYPKWGQITEEQWDECTNWCINQAKGLLRLAQIHPANVGTKCPLCDYVLPDGELLNTLLDHLAQHGKVEGVTIGDKTMVKVDGESYVLCDKTEFD